MALQHQLVLLLLLMEMLEVLVLEAGMVEAVVLLVLDLALPLLCLAGATSSASNH